jgi:hypothetical protein
MFLAHTEWKIVYMGRLEGKISRCVYGGEEMDLGRCGPTRTEKKRPLLVSRIISSQKRHDIVRKRSPSLPREHFIELLPAGRVTDSPLI